LRRRLLWGLLAILALALLALAVRHDPATLSRLGRFDLSSLAEKLALIVFGAAFVLSLFRERVSHSLESGLIWIVVALLLVTGFSYRVELREGADRVLAQLTPNRIGMQERAVEITRGRTGDFAVASQVNGARIAMMLDTGASAVVLTYEAARAAGLPLEVLNYSVNVDTANGRARAAPVTLDRLAIGNVTERSVAALITPPGQLKTSLLGMSFLNRLESWEVRGDRLMMRGYP
jgi:aspartyl protease family protein